MFKSKNDFNRADDFFLVCKIFSSRWVRVHYKAGWSKTEILAHGFFCIGERSSAGTCRMFILRETSKNVCLWRYQRNVVSTGRFAVELSPLFRECVRHVWLLFRIWDIRKCPCLSWMLRLVSNIGKRLYEYCCMLFVAQSSEYVHKH